MDDKSLKETWNTIGATPRPQQEIKPLLQEKNHAVLKKLRRQVIIEIIAFTVFLFLYYDMFDGNNKPVYANVFLVLSVLLVILHNITVYRWSRNKAPGDNIKQMLQSNISRLRTHGIVTVALRAVAAACLLVFFIAVIRFTTLKYWLLAGVIAVYLVQLCILAVVQRRRVHQLQQVLHDFGE